MIINGWTEGVPDIDRMCNGLGTFRFLIHDAESSDLGKSALLRMNKEENAALGERRFRVMG